MKIVLLLCGRTADPALAGLLNLYESRIIRYCSFEIVELPALKNTKTISQAEQKVKEGKQILETVENGDYVVLLDEQGMHLSSIEFADKISAYMQRSVKRIIFVIGGPYGFDEKVYARANEKLSLSKMTFSHQMVRVIFSEQLYRAFTIIKGEPYHHA